jgi:carbon-monoxide dehydrogenase large subunit
MKTVGARVQRKEDAALVQGQGRYLDDIAVPGVLHAAFVRSTKAHARVLRIGLDRARAIPGVVACLAAQDLRDVLTSLRLPIAFPAGQMAPEAMPWVLAPDEVCHVGEALAIVVAQSRALAEDAVACAEVVYEPLAALVDCRDAASGSAPVPCLADGIRYFKQFDVTYGDCEAAFAAAARVVEMELSQHRGVANPIEGRGILACPDLATGVFTVWASTQMSHELAHTLVRMLRIPEHRLRVIAPDVGGAFGAKYLVYPEDVAVAAAAHLLQRPVKWVEDRHEHFLSAIQERDQHWRIAAAVDAGGHLLGVRGKIVHDQGAFAPHSVNVPFNAAVSVPGPYVLPAFAMQVDVVRTNKVPVIPIRGAGYPQGCFAMERLMDGIADAMGIDRGEIRLRNYIRPEQMPYVTPMRTRAGAQVIYDSGDYPASHVAALQAADLPGFRQRQAHALAQGRHLGVGFAHAVKGTGRGPFESGTVRVGVDGRVAVHTGALAMGQGLATALAQICADALGVQFDHIDVTCGDTQFVSLGLGGFASRQTVTAGSSVHLAAGSVRMKALTVAALLLGVSCGELEMVDGEIFVLKEPARRLPLKDIAMRLRGLPGYAFPEGVEPGLEFTFHFRVDQMAFCNAFHVCEVEVDAQTGHVHVLRYLALQDSGTLVNPMMVEGQIHGSVVHGIGNALFEDMRYDAAGVPLTTDLSSYLMPTANEVPAIEVMLRQTPSPLNPLGVKGAGEGSVIPVTAAIAAAIEDALKPFGVHIRQVPMSPMLLLELILSAPAR